MIFANRCLWQTKPHFIIIITLISVLLSIKTIAQNNKFNDGRSLSIDSLENIFADLSSKSSPEADTSSLHTLDKLIFKYIAKADYDKAMVKAMRLKTLADKVTSSSNKSFIKVGVLGKAAAFYHIGTIYLNQNNYPKALEEHFKALKLYEQEGSKKNISHSLIYIGHIYERQYNHTKALEYFFKAEKLAEEAGNMDGMLRSYNNIGIVYENQGDVYKAIEAYTKALKISEEILKISGDIGYKIEISMFTFNIGNMYAKQGNYPKALELCFKSLKLFEGFNEKKGILQVYNCLGNIYYQLKNYPRALDQYNKAISISKEIGNKWGLTIFLSNVGNIYDSQGNYAKALEQYLIALKIGEEIGDKAGVGTILNNIGSAYKHQGDASANTSHINPEFSIKKDVRSSYYKKALEQFFKSLKIYKEIVDKRGITYCYFNIADIYLTQIKLNPVNKNELVTQAEKYYKDALTFSNEMKEMELIKDCYNGLCILSSTMGKWQSAYEYHKQYIIYRDSLLNEENSKKILRTEMNFEFEKKEQAAKLEQAKKDTIISEERKKEKIIISSVSVILVLVLILAVIVFRNLKQNEKKNIIIAKQKSNIEGQEEEKSRIALELHDGVGQLLSAVKLNILGLEQKLIQQNKNQLSLIDNINSLVDESVKEIRFISHNLSPSMFGQSNLEGAITQFVEKINAGNNFNIVLQIVDVPDNINKDLVITIYRIIQEAVNNIIKHAKATQATIQVIRHENILNLMIEDNGLGFDSSKTNETKGIGMANIHSRISLWNGTLNIDSSQGRGTTLIIEIPIV